MLDSNIATNSSIYVRNTETLLEQVFVFPGMSDTGGEGLLEAEESSLLWGTELSSPFDLIDCGMCRSRSAESGKLCRIP